MFDLWLPGAARVDLSRSHGDGDRPSNPFGVIAHVNQSNGNLVGFFTRSNDVCPNFQVYKNGLMEQYLPMNWRPWCQSDGNADYAAIETEGFTDEPWTAAQLRSVAVIYEAYWHLLGVPLALADSPGQYGFGWHGMGGVAWGNHPNCPGGARKAQRTQVLALVASGQLAGGGTPTDNGQGDDVPNNGDFYNQLLEPIIGKSGKAIGSSLDIIVNSVRPLDDSEASFKLGQGAGLWDTYEATPTAATLKAYQDGYNVFYARYHAAAPAKS